jgi:hypothetical protein
MMRRRFKIEKIPLDVFINILIELYEKGMDYVDLYSNDEDPNQDKLVILTKDGYINPDFMKDGIRPEIIDNTDEVPGFEDNDDDNDEDDVQPPKQPPLIEMRRLTDEDINDLL